jgi:hypothetical protein
MEDFPKEPEGEDLSTHEEAPVEETQEDVLAPQESGTSSSEQAESIIDHWEMVKVMRKFGFTDINEHPGITKEMRDQNLMYGTYRDDRGETVTTIWKDGYCWARKGNSPQLQEIEEEIGRSLVPGALQPHNLVFEHTSIE